MATPRPSWLARPPVTRLIYVPLVTLMALTGFGQMPIYKRYYMSDIPGFGWLADYYLTRNLHYAGAVVLLALVTYAAAAHRLAARPSRGSAARSRPLSASGRLRAALLAGVVATGAVFVIKNLPHVHIPDAAVTAVGLGHLGLVLALLITHLVCSIRRRPWLRAA